MEGRCGAKIDAKSSPARGHRRLTLVPFVRDASMAAFALSVAGAKYPAEAAAFDEAGVTFGTLNAFANRQHLAFDAGTDFELGMRVLLWRCAVIVIVCRGVAEAEEARERLAAFGSTYAFFAVLPLQGGRESFVEVNPRHKPKEEPELIWRPLKTRRRPARGASQRARRGGRARGRGRAEGLPPPGARRPRCASACWGCRCS